MRMKLGTTVAAAASGAAALATLGMAARPWYLRWGATDEEIHQVWPGDELSPHPLSAATRAITIPAPGLGPEQAVFASFYIHG